MFRILLTNAMLGMTAVVAIFSIPWSYFHWEAWPVTAGAWSILILAARSYFKERRRLHSDEICYRCEYDLRGSEGACPECGAERLSLIKEHSHE